MPRPKHIRDREAAMGADLGEVQAEPRQSAAGVSGDTGVDRTLNRGQGSSRTGSIVPQEGGAEVFEPVARSMGWVPRDEWTRDPSQWTDAKSFLEDQPRRLSDMKARIRTLGAVTERQMEEERRTIRETAERELREAAAARDPDRAVKAGEQLAKVAGPPPETAAWLGRNPWFNADPEARAVAAAVVEKSHAAGLGHREQLEAAEAAVRKRFPEHFGGQAQAPASEEPRGERRLADYAGRNPPAMAEGQRGGSNRRSEREPGWGDIPSLDREAMRPFFRRFRSRGWDDAKIQRELATDYWRNKGG